MCLLTHLHLHELVIVLCTNTSYDESTVYGEGLQPLNAAIAGSNAVEGMDVHPLS